MDLGRAALQGSTREDSVDGHDGAVGLALGWDLACAQESSVSLLVLLGTPEAPSSCRLRSHTEVWADSRVVPAQTHIDPSGTFPASSLGIGTILGCVFQVTSSTEASSSLGGEVMPCPQHVVTSFPWVSLCEDCSPNQDGDAAHYKLVRQRLCATSPRQAV